jgi:tetratricopeptide (TPR) repeat protein
MMTVRWRSGPVLVGALMVSCVIGAAQTQAPAANSGETQNGTAAAPVRPPIRTKTREEYQAYQAAVANMGNPLAMEKAADEFAAKFPNSEVRVLLYRSAMSSFQNAGNPEKMADMGMKVLALDANDPEALIAVAEILEEHTMLTDLDRQQRAQQALDYAVHALKTIDTDLAVPAEAAPARVEAYKKYLRATALTIIGTIYYKQENYAEAESNLQNALFADPTDANPVIVLRLALALHQEKKYSQALEQANRAVEMTQEASELGKMARTERDRLLAQVGGSETASVPESKPAQTPATGEQSPATSAPASH